MIYNRSGTQMDSVSSFFPQNGLSRVRGLKRLGLGDDLTDWGSNPADTGPSYPTDIDFGNTAGASADPTYSMPASGPAPTTLPAPTSQGGDSFWSGLIDKAPALLKDMALAAKTGDIQSKLLDVNMQRARQGLPPIDAGAYSPSVNVGVAPATMKKIQLGLGLGAAAIIAAVLARRKRA